MALGEEIGERLAAPNDAVLQPPRETEPQGDKKTKIDLGHSFLRLEKIQERSRVTFAQSRPGIKEASERG